MSDRVWHDLGAASEIGPDEIRGARVGGNRLCIGRSGDTYFAVDDTCPHAAGSLSEGMIDDNQVICPLHAYGFDVKSGHCSEDPSCSIKSYEVRIENGQLQVKL